MGRRVVRSVSRDGQSKKGATVRLKPSTYQPSQAELEEDIRIEATPEDVARAVLRPVRIVKEDG